MTVMHMTRFYTDGRPKLRKPGRLAAERMMGVGITATGATEAAGLADAADAGTDAALPMVGGTLRLTLSLKMLAEREGAALPLSGVAEEAEVVVGAGSEAAAPAARFSRRIEGARAEAEEDEDEDDEVALEPGRMRLRIDGERTDANEDD